MDKQKIKNEISSFAVTFITTFLLTAGPMLEDLWNNHTVTNNELTWALITPIAVAGVRAAIKAVYTKIIHDYANIK